MRRLEDGTGPFTLAHALQMGLTLGDVRGHVSSGRWLRLRRNVFVTQADRKVAARSDATLHAQDVRAFELAFSRRRLLGAETSAARVLGIEMRHPPGPDAVLLTDDPGVSSTHRDGYFLRVAPLDDREVRIRHGAKITSPARTLLDLSANHGFDAGVVATESAYRKKLITPAEFKEAVDAAEGRPGIRTVREVSAFAHPRIESVLESVSRLSMRTAGIQMPLVQYAVIRFPEIRVDFFWPWLRLVGEADGMAKYEMNGRRPMDVVRDERFREQRLRDADCDIVRWDWRVACDPDLLAARILSAMERAEHRLRGRAG
jgi:hypothetical protein